MQVPAAHTCHPGDRNTEDPVRRQTEGATEAQMRRDPSGLQERVSDDIPGKGPAA